MTHRLVENKRKPRLFLYCLTMLWSLTLLTIFALINNAAIGAILAIAALLSPVGTIIGSMEPKPSWSKLPNWLKTVPPSWFIIVILVINSAISIAWPAWIHIQETRPINAMSQITALKNNERMLPGQGSATIEISIEPWRKYARVTLQSSDHNPELGTCRPSTEFHIIPEIAGNPGKTLRTSPGVPVTISIPPLTQSIRLSVTVANTRQEMNCAVDLKVSDVTLTNN